MSASILVHIENRINISSVYSPRSMFLGNFTSVLVFLWLEDIYNDTVIIQVGKEILLWKINSKLVVSIQVAEQSTSENMCACYEVNRVVGVKSFFPLIYSILIKMPWYFLHYALLHSTGTKLHSNNTSEF